jgi:hypothetical protein
VPIIHLILATTWGYEFAMKLISRATWSRGFTAVLAGGALLGALAGSAFAQETETEEDLGDPRVSLYSSEMSEKRFVLDRSGDFARFQFSDEPEIVQLEMVPGPRGDTFFKDECGGTVLRLTPFGGATLYNVDTLQGEAFGRAEKADPLTISRQTSEQVEQHAQQAFKAFNLEYGLEVVFEADYYAGSEHGIAAATLANTVDNALTALRRIASEDVGYSILVDRITRVSISAGQSKSLLLEDRLLRIEYIWGGGVSERPSSREISCFLENNL